MWFYHTSGQIRARTIVIIQNSARNNKMNSNICYILFFFHSLYFLSSAPAPLSMIKPTTSTSSIQP